MTIPYLQHIDMFHPEHAFGWRHPYTRTNKLAAECGQIVVTRKIAVRSFVLAVRCKIIAACY